MLFARASETRRNRTIRRSRPAAEPLERRMLLSAGDLDPTFSGDGKLAVRDDIFNRTGEDAAIQSDGKVLVVGTRAEPLSTYSNVPGPGDVIVARRNADLTPDAGFGTGGEVRVDLGGDDGGRSVAVDSFGRILVGAATRRPDETTWTVLRFLPDGRPDTTFGTGGRASFAGAATYRGIADLEVAPSGRILVAGATSQGPFSVVAFTPAGQIDTGFGGDGVVAIDFGYGSQQEITALATMDDGRVVAAGIQTSFQGPWSTNPSLVARLTPGGGLDATFDGDGKVVDQRAIPGPISLDAAVDAEGRVVLAGSSNGADGFVMRRRSDGTPDTSFGTRGVVVVRTAGFQTSFRSVAVTPDGDVTAAGAAGDYDFLIARVSAEGLMDSWVVEDFYGGADRAAAVVLTPGGDAVVAGTVGVNDFTTYGVARFKAGDDPSHGAELQATGPFEGSRRRVNDAVVQPDRKIVVAGSTVTGPDFNFFLERYRPDGTPDPTFGGDGRVVTDFGADRNDEVISLLLRPDGTIVAVGDSRLRAQDRRPGNSDVAIARYRPDGSLDPAFGGGGLVLDAFGRDARVTDADLYPGGGLVVSTWVGVLRYTAAGEPDTTFAGDGSLDLLSFPQAVVVQGDKVVIAALGEVERYNADGTRDTTFDSPALGASYSGFNDLALAGDGDVLVLGTSLDYDGGWEESAIAVWKLNGDGSLDASFGSGGRATVSFPGFYKSEFAGELAVQPDGKIVAVAQGTLGDLRGRTDGVNAVARLTGAGAPDGEFGLGGTALVFTPIEPTGMAIDAAGDIVVAGNNTTRVGFGYAVYRLDGTGADPSARIDRETGLLTIRGGPGDDRVRVGVSRGRVFAYLNGALHTFMRTSARRVFVHVGDGNDSVTLSTAVPNMQVFGGGGDDALRGSPGRDWLDGGAGNDTLDGGLGADNLTGGEGTDSLDYRSRTADVSVHAYYYDDDPERVVRVGGEAGEGDRLGDYFEKVYGGSGNDALNTAPAGGAAFGGAGNDTLRGGAGPDALWGDAGDDLLVNSAGADYLRGGPGGDTVTYAVRLNFDPLTVTLDGTADDGRAGEGDNVYSDVEHVVGGYGNDRITGSGANNRLDGGYGNDTLAGAGGNDTLVGGQGDDTLNDTQGSNTLDGGTGTDTFNGAAEAHQSDLLETEDARLYGVRIKDDHGGYTGGGYGDYGSTTAAYVEWTYFSSGAGPRTLSFRYADGGTRERPLELRVNGTVVRPALVFAQTGGWSVWRTVEVTVDLAAGMNTIRLTATGDSGGNFDSMMVV